MHANPGLAWRARAAIVCLVVTIVGILAGIFAEALNYQLLLVVSEGRRVTEEQQLFVDGLGLLFIALQLLILIPSAVFFLMWVHRAYKGLIESGVEMRSSAGWAVGGFFIPLYNLFHVPRVLSDVWSAGLARVGGKGPRSVVAMWWAAMLVSNGLNRVSSRQWMRAESVDDFMQASGFQMSADVVTLIAAITGIVLVHRLTRLLRSGPAPDADVMTPPDETTFQDGMRVAA